MKKKMKDGISQNRLNVKEQNNFYDNKGITLVALVITIIIIIILAVVALNFVFGDNGLIKRATDAGKYYANDTAYTEGSITNVESYIDGIIGKNNQETETTSIYAKLYSYNDGSGDVLEFSSNKDYEDTSSELTLKEDYGDIGGDHYYVDIETENMVLPPWINLYSEESTIKTVKIVDEISPTYTSCWFMMLTKLEEIQNIHNINTSNVVDMSYMFIMCYGLTNLDLSKFDTRNVTDMSYMFAGCTVTSLDLSSFNTNKVTDVSEMFSGCSYLISLNLSSFDTSNVTDMNRMFSNCQSITSLDLSSFDTSNVTDMSSMFSRAFELTSLDLSNFDTRNVTNMSYMFSESENLTTIYVGTNWSDSQAITSSMFENCGTDHVTLKSE